MIKNTVIKNVVRKTEIFKGDRDSPFLAPRGVFLINNKVFVADTAQNRLFIWNEIPNSDFQKPDVVLGQSAVRKTGRNALGKVNASTLFYPSGIWSDGQKLIVADAWNHRVLIWLCMPLDDGQPADVVVGQKDFESNLPNIKGISHPPSSQSLNWPYGVYSDGIQLWIADTGNRRVLHFDKIPNENFAAASNVIGQPNFQERDYDHNNAIWPYSIKISTEGQMTITDTQYYRVLLWNDWKTSLFQKADVIIGQSSFEANGQNQYGWFPKANTLNWCYDTCFYKDGIWVADTGSSRILWFAELPRHHNAAADNVIGHDNFTTGSENKNTIWNTEGSLYWPFQLCIEGNTMVAADTGNHRIVINHLNI